MKFIDILQTFMGGFLSFLYVTMVSTAVRFGNGTESVVNGSKVMDS